MTFTSENAYIVYNGWKMKVDAVFECMLKTEADSGIILFNEGWKK